MRVLILALDGLEYNLVVKWRLKYLMQETYGVIKLTREYMTKVSPQWVNTNELVPYTPIIWTSFLTGKKPNQHGVKHILTYHPILEKIRWLPVISWVRGKRKILWRLGLKPRITNKNSYIHETFIDKCNGEAIFFMCYNYPTWMWMKLQKTAGELGSGRNIEELERTIKEIYVFRLKTLREKLSSNWRLLAVYFETLDWFGHLWYVKHKLRLYRWYKIFDKLAGCLRKHTDILLIVSDHGMQDSGDGVTGNHSNHAFWSINIETDWRPKEITDFHDKIIEWCNKK